MSCGDVETSLGAYVLGALEPAERSEVEAHLAVCHPCRDELAELAGLPGLLQRLSPEEAFAGPPVAESAMLDRFLARAAREHAAHRRRRLIAVAAAVAVLLAGGGAALSVHLSQPRPAVVAATDPATHVRASVELTDRRSGTRLTVRLRGVPPETLCRLVAVDRAGRTEVTANWEASYTGEAEAVGWTSFARRDLTQLRIETPSGQPLVVVPVH